MRYENSKQHFRGNFLFEETKGYTSRQSSYLRSYHGKRKRLEISVKRSIEDKSWNPIKGMAKGSREEITKLNQYLDQFKAGIVESYQQLAVQKKLITAELLKNTFLGKDQQDFTICKLIAYHNAEEGKNLEWGTMKNYMTTQKYIMLFLKEKEKTSDKFLSELQDLYKKEESQHTKRGRPKKNEEQNTEQEEENFENE